MSQMKNLLLAALFVLVFGFANAQEPIDGVYEKVTTVEKEIIPYDDIREADVFWSKRLWRIIDTREKMNLIFAYPQLPLAEIIHTAAMNGDLTTYDNTVLNSDQFLEELTTERVRMIGNSIDTTWQINAITLTPHAITLKTYNTKIIA
mgnify:CR=1 FL=1